MAFSFPVTIYQGTLSGLASAPAVSSLSVSTPLPGQALLLMNNEGARDAGLYLYDGKAWRFAIPSIDISLAIIKGYDLSIYYAQTAQTTLPTTIQVFKNGVPQAHPTVGVPGGDTSVYGAMNMSSGGGGAGVGSINGITGAVTFSGVPSGGIGVTTTATGIQLGIQDLNADEGTF